MCKKGLVSGMNILVDKERNLDTFFSLQNLSDVLSITGSIDNLILGNPKETGYERVSILLEISNKLNPSSIIYIANPDNLDLTLKIAVQGLGGFYYDDEFFLETSEDLSSLINDKENIKNLITLPGESVIKEFNKSFKKGDIKTPTVQQLSRISETMEVILQEYHNKQGEIIQLSEETLSIFKDISKINEDVSIELSDMQSKLKKALEQVELRVSEPVKEVPVQESGVLVFPRLNINESDKKIIKIKDINHTKYLTSFLICFVEYLTKVHFLKCKMIVIDPVSDFNSYVPDEYPYITKDNVQETDLFTKGNIIFTNYPTISVMNLLMSEENKEIFIVVDRTIKYKEHLFRKNNLVFYACNSQRVALSLGIHPNTLITSSESNGSNFIKIPRIKDYSDDVRMREQQYLQTCQDLYEKLLRGAING